MNDPSKKWFTLLRKFENGELVFVSFFVWEETVSKRNSLHILFSQIFYYFISVFLVLFFWCCSNSNQSSSESLCNNVLKFQLNNGQEAIIHFIQESRRIVNRRYLKGEKNQLWFPTISIQISIQPQIGCNASFPIPWRISAIARFIIGIKDATRMPSILLHSSLFVRISRKRRRTESSLELWLNDFSYFPLFRNP